jgi:hypothetical protein
MGMVVMSKRELNRLDVLVRLDSDRLTARAAAELMTITLRQRLICVRYVHCRSENRHYPR